MRGKTAIFLFFTTALGLTGGCAGMKKEAAEKVGAIPIPGVAIATTELPSPTSPLIAFRILFRVGSINDPAGKEGIAALTARVMANGGTPTLTYKEVVEALYPMAASTSVHVDKEVTVFEGNVHRDHLDAFYRIASDLILRSRWDPSDFKRNRDDQINYIKNTLRGNDDENLGKEALNNFIYENHPYGHLVAGTVVGVSGLTLADLKEFAATHYTQANLEIGIAGGYPEGFMDRVRGDFSVLPAGESLPDALPDPRPFEGIEVLIVEKENIATAISLGFPVALTRSDRDFYALMVANSYLGEHRTFNGILMQRMRGARGLNYGDYSYMENFIQDGGSTFPVPNIPRGQQFFSIWIRPVAHENAHFALRQAVRELAMLVENGMSEEDFEATRKFLINYSKLWVQTASRRLGYLMDSKWYGTDYFIDRIAQELPALTVEEVNAAIRMYLQADDMKVVLVTRNGGALRDALVSDAVSSISYQTPGTPQEILAEDKLIESYPLRVDKERVRVVSAQEMFEW